VATVRGKTSIKIDDLINGTVNGGYINVAGQLILVTAGGAELNAGLVTKPVGEPWSSTVTYNTGDVVGYAGAVYRARQGGLNKPPVLFSSYWLHITGQSYDGWSEKDPFFDGDDRIESWEYFWKSGNPTVAYTTTAGEFETGRQAIKISCAAGENQRFYQREENVVKGGEYIVATVRAKLLSASAGAKLQGNIMQNDATGTPTPFASGSVSAYNIEGDQVLTTAWATYTFTFLAANAKPRAGIHILAVAPAAAVFLIDSVRITRRSTIPLDSYPVGSIYMSVNNVNPGTIFGGTWSAWGSGRMPVGVDAGQIEFDTVEETGGAKTHTLLATEMPSHTHSIAHDHNTNSSVDTTSPTSGNFMRAGTTGVVTNTNLVQAATPATSGSAGSGAAHNNLPPYITCYMFKRTA